MPESTAGRIALFIVSTGLLALATEWIIVTDREAVAATIDRALGAIEHEDPDALVRELHDDFDAERLPDLPQDEETDESPAAPKTRLKKRLRHLFSEYAIEGAYVIDQDISISGDRALFEGSVYVRLDPQESVRPVNTSRFKFDPVVILQRQNDAWKIRSVERSES